MFQLDPSCFIFIFSDCVKLYKHINSNVITYLYSDMDHQLSCVIKGRWVNKCRGEEKVGGATSFGVEERVGGLISVMCKEDWVGDTVCEVPSVVREVTPGVV